MTARRGLRAVPDTPRRGLGLVRVSLVGDRGDDLTSPELQRSAITEYAQQRGIVVVEWVEALDESASKSGSRWWARLDAAVDRVEAGTVDVILVWKFSRAARHRRRWAVAIDRVEVAGGSIESATEQVDATTSTGRLARGMLSELAAWEADVKREQWAETHSRRRRAGLPATGGPRFGYVTSRRGGYQPDPETGPILAELYRRYVAGEGLLTLARWLNARDVRTVAGGRWSGSGLGRMLDTGFGAGLLHSKRDGSYLPGAHPAVIDAKLWRAYLAARRRNSRVPSRVRSPAYPLTGLVRCACGAPLSIWSQPGRPGYLYVCSAWRERRTCPGVWVTRVRVEQAVRDELRPFAEEVDAAAAAKVGSRASVVAARAERDAVDRQIRQVDRALERGADQAARGVTPEAVWLRVRGELERELAVLVGERERFADLAEPPRLPSRREVARVLEFWDVMPAAVVRGIVASAVDRVVVHRSERRFTRGARVEVMLRW